MKVLTYRKVPAIYSAIGRALDRRGDRYTAPDREHSHVLYHCLKCGADFHIHHRYMKGMGYYGANDSNFFKCPICGCKHKNYRGEFNVHYDESEKWVPSSISLRVKELKKEIVLEVRADVWNIREEVDLKTELHEEFRFNIADRKTTFSRWMGRAADGKEVWELGNPFDDIIFVSVLRHLRSDNLSKAMKAEILAIMKVMREAIRAKWKQVHGYKLKGGYVSYGQYNGYMLFPLLNLSYRLVCPDAGDLPGWLSGSPTDRRVEYQRRCFDRKNVFGGLAKLRSSKNCLDEFIRYYGLPDTTAIRRFLCEDTFRMAALGKLAKIVPDQNHLLAIYEKLITYTRPNRWEYTSTTINELITSLGVIATGRKGGEIRNFLDFMEKFGRLYLRDTANMYRGIPEKVKSEASKVKLKHLHDWLVEKRKRLDVEGFTLDVPEHVVRRLQMQVDQTKFYLPNHSDELQKGSDIFHNCVRTYSRRVLEGECQIVYMSNDDGKLVACLEVKGDSLVQAKLKYNQPCYRDSAVNASILDWCKQVGLKVETHDVQELMEVAV